MKHALALSALAFSLALGSASAYADVAPPNSTECGNKNPGDACTDDAMNPGVCTASTCSKLDYSDGSPPGTVQYACTLCLATDGGAGGSSSSSGSSGGGCATAPLGTGGTEGAFWLAAAFALPLLRRRRRQGGEPARG